MTHAPQDNSTEQRRRLLKGALGASTIVTLGYGAPAAANSISCVAKISQDGGYRTADNQFFLGEQPPPIKDGTGNWAWQQVDVHSYKVTTSNRHGKTASATAEVEGFVLDNVVYSTKAPHGELIGAQVQPTAFGKQTTVRKKGWVLVYFDQNGQKVGAYPQYKAASDHYAPASASCLNSINAGANKDSSFTFGG